MDWVGPSGFGPDTKGQKLRHLGGRSEIRAGSLGEEWGGDSSREPEENWVSREGQHMKAGAWALEQRRGSRQESSRPGGHTMSWEGMREVVPLLSGLAAGKMM